MIMHHLQLHQLLFQKLQKDSSHDFFYNACEHPVVIKCIKHRTLANIIIACVSVFGRFHEVGRCNFPTTFSSKQCGVSCCKSIREPFPKLLNLEFHDRFENEQKKETELALLQNTSFTTGLSNAYKWETRTILTWKTTSCFGQAVKACRTWRSQWRRSQWQWSWTCSACFTS